MLKIYDDKLAEEICARMDEEILALDAHITELLNYGKLPEIVASMQARREAAERVKSNIRRVNEEAHRIDAEAAAELRKETEKLRAFSQKLDDINAMLVSVMKPEAMRLSNDSGAGVGETDVLGDFNAALLVYEKEKANEYMENYLIGIGISEDNPLYDAIMKELEEGFAEDFNTTVLLLNLGTNPRADILMQGVYGGVTAKAISRAYKMQDAQTRWEFDWILVEQLEGNMEQALRVHNEIGLTMLEVYELLSQVPDEDNTGKIREWKLKADKEVNDYAEAHAALLKYGINNREEAALFFANVMEESGGTGRKLEDIGNDNKYDGSGALQLTNKENYKNYAIALLLDKYPKLAVLGISSGDGRDNNNEHYDDIFKNNIVATTEGLEELQKDEEFQKDLLEYKKIVDEGEKYVSENYAWDSAGWIWSGQKNMQQKLSLDDGKFKVLGMPIETERADVSKTIDIINHTITKTHNAGLKENLRNNITAIEEQAKLENFKSADRRVIKSCREINGGYTGLVARSNTFDNMEAWRQSSFATERHITKQEKESVEQQWGFVGGDLEQITGQAD